MEITTSRAQISVKDNLNSGGVSVNSIVSGFVVDLYLWNDSVWVARRKGSNDLHLMIAPSDNWRESIENEGFEIIGKLSDMVSNFHKLAQF